MAITAISRDYGVNVSIVRVSSSDSLATVAGANYILNQAANIAAVNNGVFDWLVGDLVLVAASDGDQFFQFNGNNFSTLIQLPGASGTVTLPVVADDFVMFDGTLGALYDKGFSASDASKSKVVMANGAVSIDNLAVFVDTAGTVGQNQPNATNAISSASAAPGALRSIIGSVTLSNATYANGSNSVAGIRGLVNCVGASSGFIYGVQGKVAPTGSLSGSIWAPCIFGQYDLSAATINAGQIAAIWGDMGATGGTFTDVTGARMFAGTNTIASLTLNSMIYLYGKATNLFELSGSSSTYISTGAATPSGDMKKLAITIDGVTHYILAAAVWS